MAKSNSHLSNFLKPLSSPKVGRPSFSGLLGSVNLVHQAQTKAESPVRSRLVRDTTLSMNVKNTATGIRFGSPSNSGTPTSQSSNPLTNLFRHTASGGIASALGGGLSGIVGLGGVISGIIGLFGGSNSRPPPLVDFHLPQSQDQTVYVSSKGNTTFQGTVVEQASRSTVSSGTYTGNNDASNFGASNGALRYQSMQIAQAVKNALLNSSSLNDVIAEI